jgi:putative ABC transport system permease protein
MESFFKDARYAVRMLATRPGSTLVTVLALALGIGANTAVFSVVNAVLLRPLPFSEPDRIVSVNKIADKGGLPGIAAFEYLDWQQQNQSFEQVAAYSTENFNLTGGDEPEQITAAQVTANFFPLLGVQPVVGRAFRADEDLPGASRVAVVSQGFWQRRFGADPGILGNAITLDDKSYTIVGVLPASLSFPGPHEIWVPLALDPEAERKGDFWTLVQAIARLKPGLDIPRAQADLDTISARTNEQYPDRGPVARLNIVPLHEQLVGDVRTVILVLLGAVGFVLAVACANVANLLLARAATRKKEIAIRIAVGAGRMRVVRQLLTESLLLALLGGAAGILLALWGVDLIVSSIPRDLATSIHNLNQVSIDRQVLAFTFGVSVITGIIFGLAPALIVSKPNLSEVLKEGGKSGAGAGGRRLRRLLVISELALALVLLIGAGLMIKSFARLINTETGFISENVLMMRVELPRSRYSKPHQSADFFHQSLERIKALPGVESAGLINHTPMRGYGMIAFFSVDGERAQPGSDRPIPVGVVSPDYFRALSIRLLQGRYFTETDGEGAPNVAIINEAMARRFFGDKDPIGRQVGFGCEKDLCRTIVGVVGDTRLEKIGTVAVPELYLPYLQFPNNSMTLLVRTTSDPMTLVAAVRSGLHIVDKDQPVSAVNTLERHVADSVAQPRLTMQLLAIFAALALLLAALGIYGVISYSVAQRTHEIGVRIALGAKTYDILRLIVKEGMTVALVATGIGLAGAFLLTRVMETLLYGVSATDPFTYAAFSLLLILVAAAACFIPARRATRVEPGVALRYE